MPVRYVSYDVEPVSGQAVLNNFNRLLRYRGSGDIGARIERGMPYYEVSRTETVGKEGSGNMVFRGDCLSTCAYLKDKGVKVDLVYIDPPFASGADYAKKIYLRRNPKLAESVRTAEEQIESESEFREFEEKMYGDIWDKEKYLSWMYENLMAIRSVMSENASIYVHLDWHIGHYVKVLMDEIFGEENFVNQITWQRNFAHGDVSQGAQHFGRISDYIFFYRMSESAPFYGGFTPYSKEYEERIFAYKDEDGRRWQSLPITAPGGANKGNPYFEFMGVTRYWRYSRDSLEKLLSEGRIYQSGPGKVPRQKGYLDESKGVPLQDIWTDIPAVQGQADEYQNYTTQKPEALLERIIKASSDDGMIVADFFGGSGVTAAVASRLNRRFITSDIGLNSIQTIRDRLNGYGASFTMYEIKDGVSLFRNPVQTMDKLKSLITGLRNEDSLDKFWEGAIQDPRRGLVPVYVPNLTDTTTKILDEVLLRRIIYEAIPDLDPGIKHVIVYYIDVDDLDKLTSFVDGCTDLSVTIEFRDLKDVLDDFTVEDELEFAVSEDRERLGGYIVRMERFSSDTVSRRIQTFNVKSARNDKKGTFMPIVISEEGLEMIEMVSLDCTASEGEWHSDSEVKVDNLGHVLVNGEKTGRFWDGAVRSESRPLRVKVRNICGDETVFQVR